MKSEGLSVKGALVGVVGGDSDFQRGIRSWSHHPTSRCALVPPSSGRTGSPWFGSRESGVGSQGSGVGSQRSEVRGQSENYDQSCSPALPSFPRRGDRALAWWGGSAPLVIPSEIYFMAPGRNPLVASGLPR